MIPATETQDAVSSVEHPITIRRKFRTSMPRHFTSSSPRDRILSRHLIKNSGTMQSKNGIRIIKMSFLPAVDRLPISQKVMAGSFSYGSAVYFTSDIKA